jgi:hypothetical protein
MKQRILVSAMAVALVGLVGCSSTKTADVGSGSLIAPGAQQAISEQRLENDFRRQGVKVIYSLGGNLEAIEVTGYAPVWGSSQNAAREAYRVAELEAKKSLNDFINKETVRSTTSVKMISKNLEKAQDNKTNKFATNRGRDMVDGVTSDDEITVADAPKTADSENVNREENTAVRNDALTIASRVQTTITARNQGIIGGLYLVEGNVINDGKNVRVVMRWDQKHTAVRTQVRGMMAQ